MENDLKKAFRISVAIYLAVLGAIIVYAAVIEILRYNNLLNPLVKACSPVNYAILITLLLPPAAGGIIAKRIGGGGKNRQEILNALFAVSVLRAAFWELPALFGFVSVFISGAYVQFYILSAASAAAIVLNFPKYAEWREKLSAGGTRQWK